VTSPSIPESERASTQRTRIRDAEPLGSYAFQDAVGQCWQSMGTKLLPSVASEAPGSLAPLL